MYEAAAAILQGKQVTINEGLSLGDVTPYNKLPAINALIRKEVEFLLGKKVKSNPVYFDGNDMYSSETNLKVKGNAINGKRTIKDLADLALGELKEEDDTEEEMGEAVDAKTIAAQVNTLKVGDKTNFGVVKEIGTDSVTFKSKDTPLTKIKFGQYKVGSSELVLSKLMKLKEDTALTESVSDEVAETILRGLMSQTFADWYEGDFMDYIEGEPTSPKKSEVIKEIKGIFRQFLNEESLVSTTEKTTLDSIIKDLNATQKLLSTRTIFVKRIIDEMGGTLEDKKIFERVYDKLDDVIDTLGKIKKQIA